MYLAVMCQIEKDTTVNQAIKQHILIPGLVRDSGTLVQKMASAGFTQDMIYKWMCQAGLRGLADVAFKSENGSNYGRFRANLFGSCSREQLARIGSAFGTAQDLDPIALVSVLEGMGIIGPGKSMDEFCQVLEVINLHQVAQHARQLSGQQHTEEIDPFNDPRSYSKVFVNNLQMTPFLQLNAQGFDGLPLWHSLCAILLPSHPATVFNSPIAMLNQWAQCSGDDTVGTLNRALKSLSYNRLLGELWGEKYGGQFNASPQLHSFSTGEQPFPSTDEYLSAKTEESVQHFYEESVRHFYDNYRDPLFKHPDDDEEYQNVKMGFRKLFANRDTRKDLLFKLMELNMMNESTATGILTRDISASEFICELKFIPLKMFLDILRDVLHQDDLVRATEGLFSRSTEHRRANVVAKVDTAVLLHDFLRKKLPDLKPEAISNICQHIPPDMSQDELRAIIGDQDWDCLPGLHDPLLRRRLVSAFKSDKN